MLTIPRISSLVSVSLLVAGAAFAQSTATSANTTMGTNPNPPATQTAPGNMMNSGSSGGDSGKMGGKMGGNMAAGSMSGGKSMHHRMRSHSGGAKGRVWNDTTRLEALLTDAQTNVSVNGDTWKKVANEANSLANRVYMHASGNATARSAARDLRTHVRELHKAAMAGDAAGVRTHASMALPYAHKLVDWSTPAGGSHGM